jgi:glutaredoxin 3
MDPDLVRIYTTTYCAFCTRAKSLLRQRGIAFEEIDVTNDTKARNWLVEATGRRTVPQVFVRGTSIGGCDELYALDRAGKLLPMVRGETT